MNSGSDTTPPTTISAGPLILVVDDDGPLCEFVDLALKTQGYRVVTAGDGVEALHLLGDGLRPDLVLTDLYLPRITGLDLIGWLRQLHPTLPVVLMTLGSRAAVEARHLGLAVALAKPFGPVALGETVDRVLAATIYTVDCRRSECHHASRLTARRSTEPRCGPRDARALSRSGRWSPSTHRGTMRRN